MGSQENRVLFLVPVTLTTLLPSSLGLGLLIRTLRGFTGKV